MMQLQFLLTGSGRQQLVSFSTAERHRRLNRTLRWARKRSNQELSDYIARFPKHAGKLAAVILKDADAAHSPKIDNLKLKAAAYILKRRNQGRETYSPAGENSVGP